MSNRVDNMDTEAFYGVLGVPKNATLAAIKKAYRNLSQVYHPDKQQRSGRHKEASELFTKIQEAYEVLSDSTKRDIYDVYGKMGLQAGLEVGPHLDKEDLRRQFDDYLQQRADQKPGDDGPSYGCAYSMVVDARRAGTYMYLEDSGGVDLRELLPDINTMSVSSTMYSSLSNANHVWLGGTVHVNDGRSAGGFVCGYKRLLTAIDEAEVSCMLGLKWLARVSVSRVLTEHDSANASLSWAAGEGSTASIATTRQLTQRCSATWQCNLTSSGAATMLAHVAYVTGGPKLGATISVAVADFGAALRASYMLSKRYIARCALGWTAAAGISIMGGASASLSEQQRLTLSSSVGLFGVTLKVKYSHGSQAFEVPILLSPVPSLRLAAAALLVPAAAVVVTQHIVSDWILVWLQSRREAAAAQNQAAELWRQRQDALTAQGMLSPVASRNGAKELSSGGLVILAAVYGSQLPPPDQYPQADGQSSTTEPSGATLDMSSRPSGAPASPTQTAFQPFAGNTGFEGGSGPKFRGCLQPPPPWLDVTVPLQYAVSDGTLEIQAGAALAARMGFYDPSPGAPKKLRVEYLYRGELHEVTVAECTLLKLPDAAAEPGLPPRRAHLMARLSSELASPDVNESEVNSAPSQAS